jgi:hypothetical protein
MTTIIGLDPGRLTGVCVIGEDVQCETVRLGPHGSQQMWELLTTIRDKALARGPDVLLVYEEPAMMRGMALLQIQRMIGVIMVACEMWQIPHYPVNQSTLKAWVRELHHHEGRMDKAAMMAYVPPEVGVEDDNQADAYWLARYGLAKVAPVLRGSK